VAVHVFGTSSWVMTIGNGRPADGLGLALSRRGIGRRRGMVGRKRALSRNAAEAGRRDSTLAPGDVGDAFVAGSPSYGLSCGDSPG